MVPRLGPQRAQSLYNSGVTRNLSLFIIPHAEQCRQRLGLESGLSNRRRGGETREKPDRVGHHDELNNVKKSSSNT